MTSLKEWLDYYGLALGCSICLGLVLTRLAIWASIRLNILDRPDERKIHKTPIPRMGGAAIFLACMIPLVGVVLFAPQEMNDSYGGRQQMIGLFIGSVIAFGIGMLDDLYRVSAVTKLVALFVLTWFLSWYGIITNLPLPFHYYSNLLLTMVWIAGMISAINALDHADGLAAGTAAIAAMMYFFVSVQTAGQDLQFFLGLVSVALIGSLIGFLQFNRYPARIFMGDGGSFFLGFILASLGVMGAWSTNPVRAAIVPIMILSLPIFDLVFVIVRRRVTGTTKTLKGAIVYCGKDHIGHRMMDIGFSHRGAVRIIYLIGFCIAVGALALRRAGVLEAILVFLQVLLIYVIIISFMKRRK